MIHPLRTSRILYLLLALLVPTLLVTACVVSENPITGNQRAYGYTWEQELQIGKEADAQIVQQYGVYDDPDLTQYVVNVGEAVLEESHLRRPDTPEEFRIPFTFRVLDSPIVNAFALPGGYVYVTRGLIAHLENEAQLAVVLGHEVGHVAGRHASKRAAAQTFGQLGLIGGAIFAEGVLGEGAGEQVLNLGGTAAQLLFLSYGREDERESDDVGVEYAARAGYKASEAAAFFTSLKRLSEQAGAEIPSFLSSHPDPGEREQNIPRLAQEWADEYPMDKVNTEVYYSHIDGIVIGEDPRQGYVDDGTFYHPELRFQFPVPSGFRAINQPTQVALVEENQNAIMLFTLSEAASAQAAGTAFAGQEGLTVADQGDTRVNNLPAYAVSATAQTQDGQEVRLLAYFIEYGGNVYSFLGYSAASAFSQYGPLFTRTIEGFNALRDNSRINVSPVRLNAVTADRSGPFQSFLPNTLPPTLTLNDLAIMNQVNTDTPINPGAMLKLPRL